MGTGENSPPCPPNSCKCSKQSDPANRTGNLTQVIVSTTIMERGIIPKNSLPLYLEMLGTVIKSFQNRIQYALLIYFSFLGVRDFKSLERSLLLHTHSFLLGLHFPGCIICKHFIKRSLLSGGCVLSTQIA